MKVKLVALLLGSALMVGPAMAASVMKTEQHMYKIHGKKVMVHEMTMDDGTVVYGLSKADFLRMDARRMLEQGHS